MKLKKLSTAALAMTFVLSGCGGSEDDGKNVSSVTGKEKFVVGMECNYAPFNWQSNEQTDTSVAIGGAGYCDGYDVRVARYVAEQLDREIEVKKVSWEGLQPALNSGEIDAVIAGMTADDKRRAGMDFTTPYYESEMVMIVRKSDKKVAKYNDIQQFKGKTVIGQKSTNYDTVIDQIKGVKHATPKATYPEMIVALQKKEVDGITAELPVAEGAVAANKDLTIVHFKKGKGFDIDTSVSIAMKKGTSDSQLFKDVQKAVDNLSKKTRDEWMKEARKAQPKAE
ncbi:transporter substrate-binding domain-containing protein [Longicatena caecimuris]|uniref:Putative lysine transport system substrate-binding protein/putative lysine transport system permease protein n=2 Tax=Longicatena caecimuris TaxID=1796635 RepID=A0A4R3TEA7_9FIRM|nr:transporter substrate-binding domain-containing protein [Longicatena caecimuris]MCR1869965.1 transporter substrate-binding domain-containing protein [Longicatena caecimuris]MCU0102480.1 transporter substrate-binding domain-containing protein [Longicatena caecimuris]TCU60343.1 putative lysine transport system substrate-binding protein/putative lysine transport system permease protein [Longicatena caecimuris]